jgi:FMN phosphatase YigB (HAD superfamily)
MISAIFFDFDGVLTTDKTGSLTTVRYLSTHTGIPQQELWEAFAPFNSDLLYGKASHAQIWPDLCQSLGRELDIALLIAAFKSTPMNEGMLNLARSLTARYSVGIITDNKKDRIDCLKEHAGLDAIFSPLVVSQQAKPGRCDRARDEDNLLPD